MANDILPLNIFTKLCGNYNVNEVTKLIDLGYDWASRFYFNWGGVKLWAWQSAGIFNVRAKTGYLDVFKGLHILLDLVFLAGAKFPPGVGNIFQHKAEAIERPIIPDVFFGGRFHFIHYF